MCSASIFFEPEPSGDDGGPGGTGPGADATAPVLSRLRVSPARFRLRARVSYRLSEPATVRFTLKRALRRRGRTRYRAVRGAMTRQGAQGANVCSDPPSPHDLPTCVPVPHKTLFIPKDSAFQNTSFGQHSLKCEQN